MDIDAIAKKIREAVMDSAEDQGRTFNASILDEVIAKELRLNMPAPSAPAHYPWPVVPFGCGEKAQWSEDELRVLMARSAKELVVNKIAWRHAVSASGGTMAGDDEWR